MGDDLTLTCCLENLALGRWMCYPLRMNLRDIKLVVTDIAGTVQPEGGTQIAAAYFEIIPQMRAEGVEVVIASGRQYESIRQLFAPVEAHIDIIADGGAVRHDARGMHVRGEIPQELLIPFAAEAAALPTPLPILFGAAEMAYAPRAATEMIDLLRNHYKLQLTLIDSVEELAGKGIVKASLFHPQDLPAHVSADFVEKWTKSFHLSQAGDKWMDAVMPGVNKGTAIEALLQERGLGPDQVLATGDNVNDLEMLKLVGIGLAVSGASDRVKAVADGVIENDDYLGVYRVWKDLLGEITKK